MSENKVFGEELTSKQRSLLSFNFEEEPDLWWILLAEHFDTQGETINDLKIGIINETDKWKDIVQSRKRDGFGDLKSIASDRVVYWNIRISQMLNDPGHVTIMGFYLRCLVQLKIKKGKFMGRRADVQKKINSVVSYMGNEAYKYLEKFSDASKLLATGKTPTGQEITDILRAFNETKKIDNERLVSAFLAIIVQFTELQNAEDVLVLQKYIERYIIAPLNAKLKNATEYEINSINQNIENYTKLMHTVEMI